MYQLRLMINDDTVAAELHAPTGEREGGREEGELLRLHSSNPQS